MKLSLKMALTIVCIGIKFFCATASDDTLTPLDDDPASLTTVSSTPPSDIVPDLSASNSNTDITSDPLTSLDDSNQSQPQGDNGLEITLPIIGTMYLYPVTENGKSGMATYLPNKNKQLVVGPLVIERSEFTLIDNKLSYGANITLFNSFKGTISLSNQNIPDNSKNKDKKTANYSKLIFDLHFDNPPTLDLMINGAQAELTNMQLVLNNNDKQAPTKIIASTKIFDQEVSVTIGIGKKSTGMWAQLSPQKLVTLIPDLKDTPLENSTISKLQITLKNITSKDNKPPRFIFDGEIEAPKIDGIENTKDSAKQLTIRVLWDNDNGGYLKTSATTLAIPSVATINNASFIANFPRKSTSPATKKSSPKKQPTQPANSFILNGDISVTVPDVGSFDTNINAVLNKKGFAFASTVKQTVSFANLTINPVIISYSSMTKKLILSGKTSIQGYTSTVQISSTTDKKGITTTSIQAQLDDKTLKPFDGLDLPDALKKISFNNPHFTFNKKGKIYEVTLQGTVTLSELPLASTIEIKQNKNNNTKLITIQAPNNFKMSQTFPQLAGTAFDDLQLHDALMVISTDDYNDTTNKVTYKKGLNIVANATMTGPLQDAATFAHSTGTFFVSAHIGSNPINSGLSVKISDGFTIPNNNQVSFGPLSLEIDGSNPSFALKGTLYVKPSPQDNLLTFDARIRFNATGANVAGTMTGSWQYPFGINGLIIGSNDQKSPVQGVAAEVTIVPGPEPVESLGLAGALKIGTVFAAMAVKVSPTPVLYGELNALTIADLVNMAQNIASKKIQGADNLPLANFGIHDIKMYIVPHETKIGEFEFQEGVTLRGGINFPGLSAYGNINISSSKGLLAEAYCSPIILGSTKNPLLKISKADSDNDIRLGPISLQVDSSSTPAAAVKIPDPSQPKIESLADAFKNGPMMLINLPVPSIPMVLPEIKISGQFEISDFISNAADLKISQDGLMFTFVTNLGKTTYIDKNKQKQPLLQSTIIGSTSVTLANNPNFIIDLIFQNNLQDYIQQQVIIGIVNAQAQVTAGITSAAQEASQKLDAAQSSIASSQNSASAALITANNKAQHDLQTAQDAVNSLQKRIDELNASIARHKSACDVLHPQDCGWILADGSELAAKTTAIATANATLQLSKKIAQGTLSAVNSATQITTGSSSTFIGGLNQISQGTLIIAQTGTLDILSAVNQAMQKILSSFNIQQIKYHGDLQSLATGKLGNVACTAQILGLPVDFAFTLDVHDATNSINKVVNDIVNAIKNKIQNMIIIA